MQTRPTQPWTFFALTYLITFACWIPAALTGQASTEFPTALLYLLGGFGPLLAAVILVSRLAPQERRDFWIRLVDFRRIPARWYLISLFLSPLLFLLSLAAWRLSGGAMPPFTTLAQIAAQPAALVGLLVIGLIAGPLSEEPGWRGFALDRMQARWTPLAASLILGLIWWAWHLPLFFIRGTVHYEWGIGSTGFWTFLINVIPLSILMTWIYNRTNRSILAAVLFHFAYNFTLSLTYPFSDGLLLIQALAYTAAALVALAIDPGLRRKAAGSPAP